MSASMWLAFGLIFVLAMAGLAVIVAEMWYDEIERGGWDE